MPIVDLVAIWCGVGRLRAERRTGELLKDLARGQGTRTDLATSSNDATKLEYAETLERTGISRQTANAQ